MANIDPQKILAGDRRQLAKAITLIESSKPEHQKQAQNLLQSLLPKTGKSLRLGITGTPGVGKSTFIESFGLMLLQEKKKLAVLAVDPSSPLSGGSLLGDKTRMEKLSQNSDVFIRPSPSSGTLGGVGRKTREAMLLCEAAGFDTIIVETVGVGQSEAEVFHMVDFFLTLILPAGGDDLQGIKKGVMELSHLVAINKADGDLKQQAELTKTHYQSALELFSGTGFWKPQVLTCSAQEQDGLDEIWKLIQQFEQESRKNGHFIENRCQQNIKWFHKLIGELLFEKIEQEYKSKKEQLESDVAHSKLTPLQASQEILNLLF